MIKRKFKIYVKICIVIACLSLILFTFVCWAVSDSNKSDTQKLPVVSKPTADHSKFGILNQPMKQGPDATKACLSCHTEAAKQVQNTYHWTWGLDKMGKEGMGKARIINNF
ncbi:MAG: hypothetical protein JW976_09550 [Syntrophaceae bacterium]|nr:hypothetical protein [Syntrophaceae bacterium]